MSSTRLTEYWTPLIAAPSRHEAPPSVRAQELYARANQAAYEADHWETARDLYQACVDEDPDFAPAWAQLARCHHLIAKFTTTPSLRDFARAEAEASFRRALALDQSLPLAQRLYAQLEVDVGRAADAAVRLARVIERTGPDAAVFAGLVHALRFCGLVVEGGYFCYPALATDSWLDSLRDRPAFEEVLATARERHEAAARMFREAGGDAVLAERA